MKSKMMIVFILTIINTLPFYGQKRIEAGVISGLTVSTLSEPGNFYDNEALKTGFGGGIAFRYTINPSWGLQSGIIYEQKGFRKKQDVSNGEQKITGMYNYITIPLLAEASIPASGNTRLYGLAGFYAGFKTYAENAVAATGEHTDSENFNNDIHSTDGGYTIGGGIQVPAGNHVMQIGFRYSQGFARVMSSASDDRNKSALFGVTLFF